MRLVGFVSTAALLAGCSYVGGPGGAAPHGAPAHFGAPQDPCQVAHARAPIPRGCHPSQVTIGTAHAGGFAQQPRFGAPQRATGQYGSHAGGNVHAAGLRGAHGPAIRKPRFRGALDLGVEKSVGGDLLNYAKAPFDPTATYNPYDYAEASRVGTPNSVTRNVWAADNGDQSGRFWDYSRQDPNFPTPDFAAAAPWDRVSAPDVSFGDVWSIPATVGLSGEYIVSDRATVFGRVGYSASEGTNNDAASIEGTAYRYQSEQRINAASGLPIGDPVENVSYIPNTTVATYTYDFSDMKRLDLEAGGRLYLEPIAGQGTGQTITPFVGASAGASRYNGVHFNVHQRQLSYESAFDGEAGLEFYDVRNPTGPQRVDLYDSQWVPQGRLAAGLEWQVTPKTAVAFETGVRVEGARDYSNGTKGDTNISVPVTLRGSFNF